MNEVPSKGFCDDMSIEWEGPPQKCGGVENTLGLELPSTRKS